VSGHFEVVPIHEDPYDASTPEWRQLGVLQWWNEGDPSWLSNMKLARCRNPLWLYVWAGIIIDRLKRGAPLEVPRA
jgi:hypothetical protein